MRKRGFEVYDSTKEFILPERKTISSAGYDFYTLEDINLKPGEKVMVHSNVKSYMQPDEVLLLYIRSSMGIKKGLALQNGTGIIDSDYYPNEIGIALVNHSNEVVHVDKGDRIAQGIFMKYLVADQGNNEVQRNGGFGSTDKEEKKK